VFLQEPQGGANDLAHGAVATGTDLAADEALEVVAEGDAGILGHGGPLSTSIPMDTIYWYIGQGFGRLKGSSRLGDDVEIDELCKAHPDLAKSLNELHGVWGQVRGVVSHPGVERLDR
jgi:hypothetical protein